MLGSTEDWFTCGVVGFTSFMCLYVVVSGLFFWLDWYEIRYAIALTDIFGALWLGVMTACYKARCDLSQIKLLNKRDILPIIILITGFIITRHQFGIYGMGQDEGVYQTKAIALLQGHTDNLYRFEEYHELGKDEQEQYERFLEKFTGYYSLSDTYQADAQEEGGCAGEGYLHGIPTMAAVLALSGSVLGLSHLKFICVLFYLASIWLLYVITKKIGLSYIASVLCMVMMAVSPIVIWVTKSSLTESFLTLLIVFYIYMMSFDEESIQKCNGRHALLCLAPIAFSFFHISTLMIMPLFAATLWVKYLERREKNYLVDLNVIFAMFTLGFWMMLKVAQEYSLKNLSRICIGPIDKSTLWMVPVIFSVLVLLVSVWMVKRENLNAYAFIDSSVCKWAIRTLISVSLLYVMSYIREAQSDAAVGNGDLYYWLSSGYEEIDCGLALKHTRLYANCIMSSLLLFPAAIITMIADPGWFLRKKTITIFLCFFYLVLFVNVCIQRNVSYYYYYARYIEYVVPVSILAIGICIDKIGWVLGTVTAIIGLAVTAPFSYYLISEPYDDTYMEEHKLLEICREIVPGSAVILDCGEEFIRNVGIDIKEITESDIYPAFDDFDKEWKNLKERYEHVYMITGVQRTEMSRLKCRIEYAVSEYDMFAESDTVPLISSRTAYIAAVNIYDSQQCEYDSRYGTNYIDRLYMMNDVIKDDAGYLLKNDGIVYGPYIKLQEGRYRLTVAAGTEGAGIVRITGDIGKQKIGEGILSDGMNQIVFTADDTIENVEFVITPVEEARLNITGVYLEKLEDDCK